MSGCPSEELLSRWMEGALGDADFEMVRDHLASCDDCRRAVEIARLSLESPAPALAPAERDRALVAVLGGRGPCPDANAWARWIEETVDDAGRSKLDAHLADCDDCRRAVALAHAALESSSPSITGTARHRALAKVSAALPKRRRWLWPASVAAAVLAGAAAWLLLSGPAEQPPLAQAPDDGSSAGAMRPGPGEARRVKPPKTPAPGRLKRGQVGITWVDFGAKSPDAAVTAGTLSEEGAGVLTASTSDGPAAGRDLVWAGFEFAQPLVFEPKMALRIRLRTTASSPVLICGAYERALETAGARGVWIEEEIPLQSLARKDQEGLMTPGMPLGGFFLGGPRGELLEIDWAMIVRPGP